MSLIGTTRLAAACLALAAAAPAWPEAPGEGARPGDAAAERLSEALATALGGWEAASGEAASPAPLGEAPLQADLMALRYFAEQGDERRLQAEIARLQVLYPDWTPPADPLADMGSGDPALDALWKLFSEGRLSEVRQEIARRQEQEDGWTPPAELLEAVAVAEARERLVNASELRQFETVVAIGAETPALLTCEDIDVLWRVAEAFAQTERPGRAKDAYGYVLTHCDAVAERLATMQKALGHLDREALEELLAMERTNEAGAGEFETVRDDMARQAVAGGGADPSLEAAPADLARMAELVEREERASDAQLLGWYHLRGTRLEEAARWFERASAIEPSAGAAQGLALVSLANGAPAAAEAQMLRWRDESEPARSVYLAAAANLLATDPPVALDEQVLARIVPAVLAAKDPVTAQQLGWYARAFNQIDTAGQWFATALSWKADAEGAAYGLALTLAQKDDAAGLRDLKERWAGRSDRIAAVGTDAGAAPRRAAEAPAASAQHAEPPSSRNLPAARAASGAATPAARRTGACGAGGSSPAAALAQGWCLLDANRPLAAAEAFGAALRSGAEKDRRDAAYGQSLAYLRAGLVNQAAVSATKSAQTPERAAEIQTSILADRAVAAFDRKRYAEALFALDQRSQISPERIDLLVLRGWAYYNLNRLRDAERVFEAAAGSGSSEAQEGLEVVRRKRAERR